jgi:1-acyl-sn-glycerol-3-phosphate acyltransferase
MTARATPAIERAQRLGRLASRILLTWARAARPAADSRMTAELAVDCARRTLAALRVTVALRGEATLAGGPLLVVANHVSWLDVYLLNALGTARFVAKSEVGRWPLVGPIAAAFGTFFIVRGSYRDAARVKDAIAGALRRGERVVVFPEGTTTDGTRVGPFYAALLQAAIDVGAPVQAVAIRYVGPNGEPDAAAAFIDEMSFAESLARVLRRPGLAADVHVALPLPSTRHTRRELAFLTRRWITAALLLEDAPQPERRRRTTIRRAA